jgi:hypothetical protein
MSSPTLRAARRVDAQTSARSDLVERKLQRYRPELQHKVRRLAGRHPRLADLAVSFPALIVALAAPRAGFNPEFSIAQTVRGVSLSEIAKTAQVPLWLRRFAPDSFARTIPKLPDDHDFRRQIANYLPRSPKFAPDWIETVAEAAEWGHARLAIWIARSLMQTPGCVDAQNVRLFCLWAWFSGRPDTFAHSLIQQPWRPQMQFKTAINAADQWRAAVHLYANLGDRIVDDMWAQPAVLDGYEFVPLRSFSDIAEEARVMRNCLLNYGYDVAHNRSRLWSIQRDGRRVATLELASDQDPMPNVYQVRGVGNSDAPVEVWWVARRWLQTHDLPRLNAKKFDWDTAPLARQAWFTLWKPY